jgi:hypothetical protein
LSILASRIQLSNVKQYSTDIPKSIRHCVGRHCHVRAGSSLLKRASAFIRVAFRMLSPTFAIEAAIAGTVAMANPKEGCVQI